MCHSCKEGDYQAKGPSAGSPHPWGEVLKGWVGPAKITALVGLGEGRGDL